MTLKKTISIFRSWILVLIHILIPVVFVILAIISERSMTHDKDLPKLELSLGAYDQPVTILSGSGVFKNEYLDILKENGYVYEDIGNKNVSAYIVNKTSQITSAVRERYILASDFNNGSIMIFFNNQPYHSPPLALSMGVNGVMRSKLNSSYSIHVSNYPLPFTINSKVSNI